MSEELKKCPNCGSLYGYFLKDNVYVCPKCDFEWDPNKVSEENNTTL